MTASENDNRLAAHMISVALDAAKGQEISTEYLDQIRNTADNSSSQSISLAAKYILCVHAAQHCGFVEPNYFVSLPELLSTDNVIIRSCVMWTFAMILPCENILNSSLIQLLFDSLKNETLGWSVAYLFRKMSENGKYIPMMPDAKWISMAKLLFDEKLSEQVRTAIVHTLCQVLKVRQTTAPVIKHELEELVILEKIPIQLFVATVNALHLMIIDGAILEDKTVNKLRHLAKNTDRTCIECIHELLDFVDHKRILSNAVLFTGDSHVKKELTISQSTSISRCEEESIEPTSKELDLDHLLGTIGYLDRTFNIEAQPKTVSSGSNRAWYRSNLQEIENLGMLATKGQLKDRDFDYLLTQFKSAVYVGWTKLKTRSSIHKMIATIFRDAARVEQAIPLGIIDEMIGRLIDDEQGVSGLCGETLLIIVQNKHDLNDEQMKKIKEALIKTSDSAVKQNLIEIYALYILKGYHLTLDLSSVEKNLQNPDTCLTASYLFFKAAAIEKLTFTDQTLRILSQVSMNDKYDIKARNNCLWAIAYSIRESKAKQSISAELINDLAKMLTNLDTSIKQTAAVALCYYGKDEKIVLSVQVLERLAIILVAKDQALLDNLVSLYLKVSQSDQIIPALALDNLAHILQHPDFSLRQKVIWIFNHVVTKGRELSAVSLDKIDLCLDDQEFHIRNPAGQTFITYWQSQLQKGDNERIRHISARLEKLLILFQHPYESTVRISALKFLQQLVEKHIDLPETILQLIEMCLYEHEAKISKEAIAVVQSYSQRRSLRKTTVVCLEHLLTTETPILSDIIVILKSIVESGHVLSKKIVDILGQLILTKSDPNNIVILLTFADRHQPLSKLADELLRQIHFAKALKYSTHQMTIDKAVEGLLQLTQKDQIFLQSGSHPTHDLVLIFTELSRQNQIISDSAVHHLEKLLDDRSINIFIIEIYQHLLERRKSLDPSIVQRILKSFDVNVWKDLSTDFRYRLTSFFNALANNQPIDADQTCLPSFLRLQQPVTILREICSAIHTLAVYRPYLQPRMIDALFQLLDSEIDTDIQEIILKTLSLVRTNFPDGYNDLKECLHLFDHASNLDDQSLLIQLRRTVKSNKKLPEAYLIRLSHMLYSCDPKLKAEAAVLLASTLPACSSLPKKTPSVTDALLHLVCYSKQASIQQQAQRLLITQKNSNVKVREFLDNQDLVLSEKQHAHVQTMFLSSDTNDVHRALKIIRAMIILDKHVPHKLLSAVVAQLTQHPDEIIDLLILAFKHGIQFDEILFRSIKNDLCLCQTEHMFALIRILTEKAVPFHEKTLELILSQHGIQFDEILFRSIKNDLCLCQTEHMFALIRILTEKAVPFHEKTLELILSQVNSNAVNEPLNCLENIARYQHLPDRLISYFVKQLFEDSDDIVKKSFSILRLQISRSYIKFSHELFQSIPLPSIIDRDRLTKETTAQQYLGTLQTLLFVEYFEPTTFELPVTQWSRQCLCIDLLTSCSDQTPDRILTFYHHLTKFELFKQYQLYDEQRDDFLRVLIEKQRSCHFNLDTVNQVLIFSRTSTNQTIKILQSEDDDWLSRMRLDFIREIISQGSLHAHYSQTVLNQLIERISKESNLLAELIEPFLQLAQTPDEILTILDLVTTYQINGDHLFDIFVKPKNLDGFKSFQKELEVIIINKTLSVCANGSDEQLKVAHHNLHILLDHGWRLSKITDLLDSLKQHQGNIDSLPRFLESLQILVDYKINENVLNLLRDILCHKDVQSWPASIHSLAIEHCFGSISSEKNVTTLLAEIKSDNPDINVGHFKNMFAEIDQAYEKDSSCFPETLPVKNWNIVQIQNWATKVYTFQSTASNRCPLSEILAVIKRAVYLDSHFEPRPIQVLAVLIMLDRNQQGGRLLQILTGEGKSTVVSILAVIKGLQNQHIDIITSSMTLAKRDAHEREKFYEYFNLSVSHNNDETSYVSGQKPCYAASIVYGTSSQFQFDLLRHEFSLLDTRSINNNIGVARRHDVIIIDEVDSMLIDENNTIARLADQLPGMEWLSSSLYGVWRAVEADADVFSHRNSIIKDLKTLFLDPKSPLQFPKHLRRSVIDSLPTWIEHAIRAKVEYRLDHHYMIKDDETRTKRIVPIDFSNTGVIQTSTTWSDGLHQFLQIKHGLKMTPLTVTTNHLSNVGLFTRYGTQIYGLTGTIGSKDAQNLLQKIYNVDTVIIPPFKEKRHIVFDSILTMSDDEWLNTIVSTSVSHAQNHRAVLIICETRLDAKAISKELQRANPTCLIRRYTDNTDAVESNAVNDKIQHGEIIVATNLAGRGTDLKTSPEVEKHGGLHVCLTFLPSNLRVEKQAFGRTSRQGNRGTSQMILCHHRTLRQLANTHLNLSDTDLTDSSNPLTLFSCWREQAERAHLDRIWTEEINEIKLKDNLFKKFCQLLAQLRSVNNDPYRLLSVKEQWGLWLKAMDCATQNRKRLEQAVEADGYECHEVPRGDDSFYHAISHQLAGELEVRDIKQKVMKHIDDNKDLYTEMNDEQQYRATSSVLNVSIIIYRSDYGGPHVYKHENASVECFLGYEVDSYYVSLQKTTTENKTSTAQPRSSDAKPRQQKISTRAKLFNGMKFMANKVKDLGQHLIKQSETQTFKLNLDADFEVFKKQIEKDFQTDDIIQNPSYLMLEASTKMQKLLSWANKFRSWCSSNHTPGKNIVTVEQVMSLLERAIKLDSVFAFDALTNYGFCLLHQNKLMGEHKTKAKLYLIKAQQCVGEYILPQLYSMQLKSTESSDEFVFDDFAQQIQIKVDILQLYLSHVSNAITVIEESQKLIDIIDTTSKEQRISKKLYHDEVGKFLDTCSGSIDISFHHLAVHNDTVRKDQAIELLKKLTNDEGVSIHFTDTNLEAMNKITCISDSVNTRVNVRYLDVPEVLKLLENMSADLTLTSTTVESYLETIKIINKDIKLATDSSLTMMSPSKAEAYINAPSSSVKSILFPSMTLEEFKKIQDKIDKASCELTFQNLPLSEMKKMIGTLNKPFSVELHCLAIEQAKLIAEKVNDRQNFVITVLNLSKQRAQAIVKSFDLKEQDVKASFKHLADQFPKTDRPHEELNTYNMLGIHVLIIIDELGPRPWISISMVVALGVGQMIGGICLAALTGGLGSSLGVALICEGVNDIVYGIRGAICRQFSWKDYGIQKGVSLAICFVTLGCSAIKQAAQAAKAAGTTGASSLLKATGRGTLTIVKNSFRTVGSGAIKGISSTSWKLACQQVAVTCLETGVRQLTNYAVDTLSNKTLSEFTRLIESEMERIVYVKQSSIEYQRAVKRAINADKFNGNRLWWQQIEQIALQLMSKQKNEYVEALKSLSSGVATTIPSHSRQYLQGQSSSIDQCLKIAQLIMKLAPMIKNCRQLMVIGEKFFEIYQRELNLLAQRMPAFEDLLILQSNQSITMEDAKKIHELLIRNNILCDTDGFNDQFFTLTEQADFVGQVSPSQFNASQPIKSFQDKLRIELEKVTFDSDTQRGYVMDLLSQLLKHEPNPLSVSLMNKKIIDFLVQQVCAIMNGAFIAPLTNFVISNTIQKMSTKIQLALDPDGTVTEKLMQEGSKRYLNIVANDMFEKIQSGEIEIDPHARKKLEELQKRTENDPEKAINYSEKKALEVMSGEQGDNITLSILAMITKTPITVLQNSSDNSSNQDSNSPNVDLKYTPPNIDEITGAVIDGHYEAAQGVIATVDVGPNDCLYFSVLSRMPNKFQSIDDMRAQCAAFILTTPHFIEGIYPAVSVMSQARTPLRRKFLMGEGAGSSSLPKNLIYRMLDEIGNVDDEDRENKIKQIVAKYMCDKNANGQSEENKPQKSKQGEHVINKGIRDVEKKILDALGIKYDEKSVGLDEKIREEIDNVKGSADWKKYKNENASCFGNAATILVKLAEKHKTQMENCALSGEQEVNKNYYDALKSGIRIMIEKKIYVDNELSVDKRDEKKVQDLLNKIQTHLENLTEKLENNKYK
ncbi:unnamed protein product [Adineta ricciae]|uniref:Protein translocase subunit SecA n=2 Tax=Adineta ricciae TaxID=249248 RepID=A0A814YH93_ADIRI|nr:unnamed protein product [Adineta ricciae]